MVYAYAKMGLMFCINLTCRYYGEDCGGSCPGLIDGDEVLECVNDTFDPETCN